VEQLPLSLQLSESVKRDIHGLFKKKTVNSLETSPSLGSGELMPTCVYVATVRGVHVDTDEMRSGASLGPWSKSRMLSAASVVVGRPETGKTCDHPLELK
jgi:hypothetical protein